MVRVNKGKIRKPIQRKLVGARSAREKSGTTTAQAAMQQKHNMKHRKVSQITKKGASRRPKTNRRELSNMGVTAKGKRHRKRH